MTALLLANMLLAAIPLTGVTGGALKARAFFDANNVKVGDPLILTVDFVGNADFAELHPPALAKLVNGRDWKVDDASAKTDTYRDARRLTYRVRPMRAGVLWFPAFEFEYSSPKGERRVVRSNDIPVHAKTGVDVVVEGMCEDQNEMPQPDPPVTAVASVKLTDDESFAWRKACAKPSADAFAAFDFAEAKMNEARCALLAGNWARAMKVYSRLEWSVGQTPAIERGIVAALAVRHDNPAVELPVWRQVGRPVLRYGWKGRIGVVAGGLVAVTLLFWLLGRLIRAFACLAAVALVFTASAEPRDIFEEMDEMMRQAQRQMQGAFTFTSVNGVRQEPVDVSVSVQMSRPEPQVGERFDFILSVESPRTATVSDVRIQPSNMYGMRVVGDVANLTDGRSANPSNVVRRLSVPVRYDVPFTGPVSFRVSGMVTGRRTAGRAGRQSVYTFSNSFQSESAPVAVSVKPLGGAGQPADFSGVISEGMRVHETLDLLTVETNDVIQITYRVYASGYLPERWMPEGAAFEMGKTKDGAVEWRRYFVADGAPRTPELKITYYDPRDRKYKTARTGGTNVKYR